MSLTLRPTVLALVLALLLGATAQATGQAKSTFVVRGAGFGHGAGMSQWGAQGMALTGADYREILDHFYPGTTIERLPTVTVRVLLATGLKSLKVGGAARVGERSSEPEQPLTVVLDRGRMKVRDAARRTLAQSREPLVFQPPRGETLTLLAPTLAGLRAGRWRGALELRVEGGRLAVVNVVSVEDYLRGVVPDEVPPSWMPEALKAQAVAARSYALSTRSGGWFQLYPDTRSQVYRGVAAETPSTDSAVAATRGEVITYEGEIARTFFHSSSGGKTENVENVFASPLAYLVGVDDPGDKISPYHRWQVSFAPRAIEARLRGLLRGHLRRIVATKRGVSPRVLRARIDGTRGSVPTTGDVLRRRLGLRSTWFTITRVQVSVRRVSAHAASSAGPPTRWLFSGLLDPAPAARLLVLERLEGGRFRQAGVAVLTRGGGFRVALAKPGVWRARVGSVVTPPLALR